MNIKLFSISSSNFAFFLRIFDEFFSGFHAKFQKRVTSVAFQSISRKQITTSRAPPPPGARSNRYFTLSSTSRCGDGIVALRSRAHFSFENRRFQPNLPPQLIVRLLLKYFPPVTGTTSLLHQFAIYFTLFTIFCIFFAIFALFCNFSCNFLHFLHFLQFF